MSQKALRRRATRITQAAALMAQPGSTLVKVAATLGVSTATISRDLSLVDANALKATQADYRKLMMAELPITERVTAVATLARTAENEFAKLRALERADAISGLHFEPPRDQQAHAEPVPLFSLPAGTRVAIQVGPPKEED